MYAEGYERDIPPRFGTYRLLSVWRDRGVRIKARQFALIGVVNRRSITAYFCLARAVFERLAPGSPLISALSDFCHCGNATTTTLVVANVISWSVAVTGSYIMNSSITFAAESGRKLGWRAYLTFVVSGIAAGLANTATLLSLRKFCCWPVWLAKAVAILTSFIVNFSLSHFVVFRKRR